MATNPIPINPQYTALAVMFKNPSITLIADNVLPRTNVSKNFKWLEFDLAQGYTIPDMSVGRKGAVNQIDFKAIDRSDTVIDYGLEDVVPNEDVQDDNTGVDPVATATSYLANLVLLGREQRVANAVFTAGNYTNTSTLSGTGQWSDASNSDPVSAISNALDVPLLRPNFAVFGQQTWTALRRHPKVVQACKGTAQGSGMVSKEEFAELFELQGVWVGASFANSAKKGQTAAMARLWGKHASFIYQDPTATPDRGVTFGFTGECQVDGSGIFTTVRDEPSIGLSGARVVRVGMRQKEVICAKDAAYFFQNAVA